MVMVPWPVTDIKFWIAQAEALMATWPEVTGRVCPCCGAKALVGHGPRQRSVHFGEREVDGRRRCDVVRVWVQRVRCKQCGSTHTLLPAFLARYQRHPSGLREQAGGRREAGLGWQKVLERLKLPMWSTASVRRWVAGVWARVPAMAQQVARWRADGPAGSIGYASTEPPGTLAAFAEAVAMVLAAERPGWPSGEAIAGANWQASCRRCRCWV